MHRIALQLSALITPRNFTTPARHSRGDQLNLHQVSSVIQWQVFHLPHCVACKQSSSDDYSKVEVCGNSLDGLGERPSRL